MNTSPNDDAFPLPGVFEFALGTLGGILLGTRTRDGRARTLLRAAGLTLIGLALRPAAEAAIRGAGERRRTVRLRESIELDRPVADVFAFFKDFENFPRVFGGLHSVVDHQDGRSHWEAFAPSGRIIAWDAVVTKYVPNAVIGWASVPGSVVETRNVIRFTPLGPARTRLDIETTYRPSETPLREAIRALVGTSHESRLRADVDHAKFYLETFSPAD